MTAACRFNRQGDPYRMLLTDAISELLANEDIRSGAEVRTTLPLFSDSDLPGVSDGSTTVLGPPETQRLFVIRLWRSGT
jgi:hypothetical protein